MVEANIMNRILDRYADISGQVNTFNKLAITFSSNTKEVARGKVCSQLQVSESECPGKYLGMPMSIGSKKKQCLVFWWTELNKSCRFGGCRIYLRQGKLPYLKELHKQYLISGCNCF